MNLTEFAALKVGDRIENPMNTPASSGEVVEAAPNGVRIVWGPRHGHETRFFYSVQSTAWMHWNMAEPTDPYCTFCKKNHPGGDTCMGHHP